MRTTPLAMDCIAVPITQAAFTKTPLFRTILVLLVFAPCLVRAQQSIFHLKIVASDNSPLPFATLKIAPLADTANFHQKLSDSSGVAEITAYADRPYLLTVSSTGYAPLVRKMSFNAKTFVYLLTLKPLSTSMGSVVVTAKRPVLRQEDDKTIVDPETLAAASTNAYEILEKTPGLFVDQDGNVYLSSNTPATIFINGRDMKMSAADLATLLKSLPPGSVERIEILRTPSAKYDASGTGGIVNVILKKGISLGTTGSLSAGFNQGRYGNQYTSFTLNKSQGKWNTNLTLQYNKRNNYEILQTDRHYKSDSVLDQHSYTVYPVSSAYLGYTIAYQFNKKWDADYEGRLIYNNVSNSSSNLTAFQSLITQKIDTTASTGVQNSGHSLYFAQGFDTRLKIDTIGSEWTNDISYTITPGQNDQSYNSIYYNGAQSPTGGTGTQQTQFGYFNWASDLRLKTIAKVTVETGFKTTATQFKNTSRYYIVSTSGKMPDYFRTSTFHYSENINAAYLQASRDFNGILLKLGTRVENTNMDGHQVIPKDTSFTLHRTDLFPYVYLSRNIMKIAGYDLRAYLVYRRTITRPSYTYLNPFPHYIDQYLYETGNPTLRPQFTKNYEANVSVDERPIFAVGVNHSTDLFNQVTYQSFYNPAVAYRTYDNLGNNKEVYLRGMGAIPPGKKYFFLLGAQFNHNQYNGQYNGKPLSYESDSWSLFTYHNFKVSPLSQLTLNGFVRFNGQQQFYELSTFGALNMSINRQFLNRKLIVTLSANDLFFTNNNHFTLNQGSIHATGYREDDTRRVGLNIRYNFGIRKKEENNPFNIESPEKKD